MLPLPFSLARKWLRTLPAPAESVRRIAVREVEERIPTIDELGNPRTVIRTSTLASFRGPTGVVEIEQARRHTLPGFGHVYPIAHNEYVVFRDHMKLRADPQMAMSLSLPVTTNVLPHSEQDVEYPEMLPGSRTALQAQDSVRRQAFVFVVGLVLVSVTLAIWTPPPRYEPSPSFSAFTPTAPYIGIVAMPNESVVAAFPTTLLHEAQPMPSSKGVSSADNKALAAHDSLARVALAIRPWGVVYVNGSKQGTSPPVRELKLKPGRYTVEVRNDPYPPHRATIDLRTKATSRVAHDFMKAETAATKESGPSFASVSRSHTRFLSEEWPR